MATQQASLRIRLAFEHTQQCKLSLQKALNHIDFFLPVFYFERFCSIPRPLRNEIICVNPHNL